MLNLDAERQAQQPWWFVVQAAAGDSPAVEVEFVPIGRAALRAARRAAAEAVGAAMSEDEDESATLSPELVEIAGDVLSEHLLLTGIRAWRGVGDAEGALAAVTPDNLRLFLADPTRFEKLDDAYVRPFVMKELEKNGLSLSPNGISAGAMPGTDTAGKSARRTSKAGAKRTRKKAAKSPAPIASSTRKPKPASASGT